MDPDGRILDTLWDLGFTIYDVITAINKSSKGDHSGWLDVGIDLTAVLIPGVPAGLSKIDDALKAVKLVDKATDTAKTVDKAVELTKAIDRVTDTTRTVDKGIDIAKNSDKFTDTLKTIQRTGKAPEGFQGGRVFQNRGGQGFQLLPTHDSRGIPITYKEWDVKPKIPGQNRGPERLVTGSDGSAWKTLDHYKTFTRIE